MIELTKFESEEIAKSKKQSTKVHKSAEVIENRLDPLGEDAAYIYRYLKKHNNVIDYKTFIKGHQSWLSNYKAINLAKNFNNCKARLKEFYNGQCKLFNIYML